MIVVQLSAIQDEPFASAFFSVRILDYDVKVFSPEILSDLRSGRRLGMPFTQPAINGRGRSGQPVNVGTPKMDACPFFCELAVTIRLQTADFRAVVPNSRPGA